MKQFHVVYANDNDAMVPEVWAQEALMVLENQMIVANQVHRDFSMEVANYGDVVNAHRPGTFTMRRRATSDTTADLQDATTTNVPVPLNQHGEVTFVIGSREASLAFKDLVDMYLKPAATALANGIDQTLLSQVYRFRTNCAGHLGTTLDKAALLNLRQVMNEAKAPMDDRNLILTPAGDTDLLNVSEFVNAHTIGDNGSAMRTAHIGQLLGFNCFMAQNTPSIATGNTVITAEVDAASGLEIGTTTIPYDGTTATLTANSFVTIEGDDIPQKIVSVGSGDFVITPGLKRAVANNADIVIYVPGTLSSNYSANYIKNLGLSGFSVAMRTGQLVDVNGNEYATIGTPTTALAMMDLPLTAAVTSGQRVSPGPAGDYNFAFHRNALALVTRPLALPQAGSGANSAVATYNNLGLRVTMQYDIDRDGTVVRLDMLYGTAVLDVNLGAVLFG